MVEGKTALSRSAHAAAHTKGSLRLDHRAMLAADSRSLKLNVLLRLVFEVVFWWRVEKERQVAL